MKQSAKAITLTGLAGAAAFAGATQSYGAVVAWNPANIVPTGATTNPSKKAFYDIDGNGTNDIEFGYYQNPSSPNEFFTGVYVLNGGAVAGYLTPYGSVYAYPLQTGNSVDGTLAFSQYAGRFSFITLTYNGGSYGFTGETTNTPFAIGFEFKGSDGALHFGYVNTISEPYVSASNPGGLIFQGGGYESVAGTAITVGAPRAVPEPGTLAALAAGAAGLASVGLKRRRRAAATQA